MSDLFDPNYQPPSPEEQEIAKIERAEKRIIEYLSEIEDRDNAILRITTGHGVYCDALGAVDAFNAVKASKRDVG